MRIAHRISAHCIRMIYTHIALIIEDINNIQDHVIYIYIYVMNVLPKYIGNMYSEQKQ